MTHLNLKTLITVRKGKNKHTSRYDAQEDNTEDSNLDMYLLKEIKNICEKENIVYLP